MARRALPFVATSAILIGCSVYDASLVGGAIGGPGVSSGAGNGNNSGGTGGDQPSAGTGPSVGNGGRPGVIVPTGGRAGASSGGTDPNGGSGGSADTGGMGGDAAPGGGAGDEAGAGGTENNGGTTTETGGSSGTNTGGSGGTGGSGEPGGGGSSTGGAGGMGGTSSAGGMGGAGGNGGAGGSPTFTGCAVLTTALDAEADKAHFLITLAADTDFTGATVSLHAYAMGALGGSLYMYVQQSTFEYWGGANQDLTTFSGWTTIDWNVGAETTTGVDKTKIRRLGIEVNGDAGTTWSNPTTVYVDSITVTTASLSFTFDTTATVFATPAADRTADRAMWLNNGSSDTTALSGSSIAWSTTCP